MLLKRLLVVAFFLTPPAHAAFTFRNGYVKVDVRTAFPNEVTFSSNGERLWNYSDGTLLYMPAGELGTITGRGIVSTTPITDDLLRLPNVVIDPRVGIPSTIPASRRIASYPSGKFGAYAVQFIGRIDPQWRNAITALGATLQQPAFNNGYLITATPEMFASIRALPYVQFAEIFHPFMKSGGSYVPAAGVVFHEFQVAMFNAPDLAEAKAEIASYGTIVEPLNSFGTERIRVRAEDVSRLLANRLVHVALAEGPSSPLLLSVFPKRAAPGSIVTISGIDLSLANQLDFDGVPLVDFTLTADERVRARVPALTAGSHSLHAETSSGSEQILAGALTVDSTNGRSTFAAGDIVGTSSVYPPIVVGFPIPIHGNVQWLDPNGFFNQRWKTLNNARLAFFDPRGFLNVVTNTGVLRYDASGNGVGAGPAFAANASEVVYDREGRATVSAATLSRHAADGTLIRSMPLPNSPFRRGDLAADACTFYLAHDFRIDVYDLCTGTARPSLSPPGFRAFALRVLPDGTLAALNEANLIIVRTDGTIVRTLPLNDLQPQMAITPDQASLLLVGETKVQAYDFATGALRILRTNRERLTASDLNIMTSLAIYGGWSAANANPAYAVDPAINDITNLDGAPGSIATINGSGFMPGARVLVNGVEAVVTNVTPTQITFIIPAGVGSPRNVTVINPNGQSVVFGSNVPSSHVVAVPVLDWRGLMVMGLLLAVAGVVFLKQ